MLSNAHNQILNYIDKVETLTITGPPPFFDTPTSEGNYMRKLLTLLSAVLFLFVCVTSSYAGDLDIFKGQSGQLKIAGERPISLL